MEQILNKDQTISRIKTGSLVIAVICVLAAAVDIVLGISTRNAGAELGAEAAFVYMRNRISFGISAFIMCCAAGVFFGVFKTGKPFSHGTVLAVRFIGILFFINGILPSAVSSMIVGRGAPQIMGLSVLGSVIEGAFKGALFIFITQIIHYGTQLQQESDETL